MSICLFHPPRHSTKPVYYYNLQLESICTTMGVINNTSNAFSTTQLSITILPISQLLGFVMDYTNINAVAPNSIGELGSKLAGPSDYQYPNITREMEYIPSTIKLTVSITIKGNSINPPHIPIILKTSINGKIDEVVVTGMYGSIKINYIMTYTYIQINQLYKWTILNSTLTLANRKTR